MDFIIDTAGQQDLHERNNLVDSENDDDEDIDIGKCTKYCETFEVIFKSICYFITATIKCFK